MGLISVLAGRFPRGAAPTKLSARANPQGVTSRHAHQLASTMSSPTYGEHP